MNKKSLIVIVLIAAAVTTAAWFFQKNTAKQNENGTTSGLFVSANAIYVADQMPARTVAVAVVRLAQPGFVAIHQDVNGMPGKILGVSGLLLAGETKNLPPIALSRETANDETFFAMLHRDDGDGTFDEAKDAPAPDSTTGEPVMMMFTVSADATEPGAVTL